MMGGGVPTSIFKRQIGVGRDIFSDTSWDFKNVTAISLPVKNNYLETVMLMQMDGTMKTIA